METQHFPPAEQQSSPQVPAQQAYQPLPQQTYVQAPYGAGQAPLDYVSLTSFILSLIGFNVIAVVLGIVGLSRTKNGQMSGRGFAIAGIVLGSLTAVVIVATIIMVGLFSVARSGFGALFF